VQEAKSSIKWRENIMKNDGNIIRDILPLYIENMVSDDTKGFVEEHLALCADCRTEAENMKKPAKFVADTDIAPLKKLKKKLLIKKIQTILFTTALVFSIVLSAVSFLTAPQYFPYSDDLISITENGNGSITIAFDDTITGYTFFKDTDKAAGIEVYRINAWNTIWDLHFTKREAQNMVIPLDKSIAVYYSQYNGAEDVFIYGTDLYMNGGTMTLPRLILVQYFTLAFIIAIVLGVLLFINRKSKTTKVWLERIFLLPVSYVIAHICIKGIAIKSFSTQRDVSIIVIVMILVYCALLSGLNLYRLKKE
jgi:uncharacterized membrane protein